MTLQTQPRQPPQTPEARRAEWLGWIEQLISEVAARAQAEEWSIHRAEKTIRDDPFDTYTAPTLRVRTPNREFHVNPIALYVFGGEGRVDLEAWPTMDRFILLRDRDHNTWPIRADSGAPVRSPWDRQTFLQLAKDLTAP